VAAPLLSTDDRYGAVYLMLGPVTGRVELANDADVRLRGAKWDYFGGALDGGRDFNGDGLDDVVISQSAHPSDVVVLFEGPMASAAGAEDADVAFVDDAFECGLGRSGSDVDDDGWPDVLIACGVGSESTEYGGSVFVVSGPFDDRVTIADAASSQVYGEVYRGQAAVGASAGDVDGDGIDDVLVGEPEAWEDGPGATYVFFGPLIGTHPVSAADVIIEGSGDDQLGQDVADVGDIDGDGLSDILVGGQGDDDGGEDAGAAWLILGSAMLP
jgi:hypothetical protein